jgi:hypothetical protein
MVPPYVDDPTGLRRDRKPAESGPDDLPAGEDSPSGAAAGAVGQDAGSVWSPWSSFRATRQEEQAASGGHDLRAPGEQGDQDQRPGRDEQPGRDERREPGDDEVAAAEPAADAGDERAGAGAAEPGTARRATPSTGLAGTAAATGGTDKAAGSDTERDEAVPGPAEPGTAEAEHADAAAGRAAGPGDRGVGGADRAGDGEEAGEPGAVVTAADGAEARGAAEADGTGDISRASVARDGISAGGSEDTDAGEDTDVGEDADQAADAAAPLDDEVTMVPGVARYHRRGCILIRFLSDGDLETMTRREAEAAGSVPCKACQPDKPDPSA